MKTKPTAFLLLVLTAAIWGFAFVAQVRGMSYIGPLTMNGVRFTVGIVALLPVVLFFERGRTDRAERKRTLAASLLAGAVLFTASTLQQLGIMVTGSAGISGFITGLYTVLIPIVCYVLFKQKTGINVLMGAVLSVIGLALLCYRPGEGLHIGAGEILLFIGTLFWTAHVIIIDKLCKNVRPLHFSWGQYAVCAVLGMITMFIFEEPSLPAIIEAKWTVLYCGVLSVAVAYTLQVIAQKNADPTTAAIVLSGESLLSAVGGALFGTDEISQIGYVGCGFMFVGIIVSQINFKQKRKNSTKP